MAASTVLGVGSERLLLGQGAGPYQPSPGFNWAKHFIYQFVISPWSAGACSLIRKSPGSALRLAAELRFLRN